MDIAMVSTSATTQEMARLPQLGKKLISLQIWAPASLRIQLFAIFQLKTYVKVLSNHVPDTQSRQSASFFLQSSEMGPLHPFTAGECVPPGTKGEGWRRGGRVPIPTRGQTLVVP
jgi:hypothetical protein